VRVKALGDTIMYASGVESHMQREDHLDDNDGAGTGDVESGSAASDPSAHIAALLRQVTRVLAGAGGVAGVHVGPVVAGVIGDDRLTFDMFGDTVNTAARVKDAAPEPGVWMATNCVAAYRQCAIRIASDSAITVILKGKGPTSIVNVKLSEGRQDAQNGEN